MAHQDKGHYAGKHEGTSVDKIITGKIESVLVDNGLACTSAHQIGNELGKSPLKIGVQADLLEVRITKCQLGLFGFSKVKKKLDPDIQIPTELDEMLIKKGRDGKISCLECWDIATNLQLKRLDVASACEKKNIRIKPCQLGAF